MMRSRSWGLIILAGLPAAAALVGSSAWAEQTKPTPIVPRTEMGQPIEYQSPPSDLPAPLPAITNPRWLNAPQAEFPERALAHGVTAGEVRLHCIVRADGAVASCEVLVETPPEMGFGESAVAATLVSRIEPRTMDGGSGPATATFTIRYRMEEPEAPPVVTHLPSRPGVRPPPVTIRPSKTPPK